MNWAAKSMPVPPHEQHVLLHRNRKMYGAQLTGEALPCFRWYTMRKLIQQSKTVEPNSTCQHRFISTGQTRPPLFPWRIYISNANWTCPFFIVSPAAPICGRDRRNREWAAGRERRRREGRCCCWHTVALPKAEEYRERIRENKYYVSTQLHLHESRSSRVRVCSSVRGGQRFS